jgi:hypothetical protein
MSRPVVDTGKHQTAFEFKDAVALMTTQTTAMFQLWAFYTATVLGSMVFGFSRSQTGATAAIFLVGYWAFALGELTLLIKTMKMIQEVSSFIARYYSRGKGLNKDLEGIVSRIEKNTNPLWPSVLIQLLGNICVTLLVVANALGGAPPINL